MEAKNKKNVWKFYSLMIITILSTGFFLQSCRDIDDSMNDGEDIPFLALSKNISNLDIDYYNLSKADLDVFRQAFGRIQVIEKDGKYEMDLTSGRQINISENLFGAFKKLLENTNEQNEERAKRENFNLRSKSDDVTRPTDCVAQVISAALAIFGSNISAGEIDTLICESYGNNGVPYDRFYEIVSNYLKGEKVEITNGYDSEKSDVVCIIVVGDDTPNVGHAVILLETMNDTAMYKDPQNNNQLGFCTIDKIVMAYMAIAAA